MWSVSTILTGLYSFMIESNPTLGSIETSTRKKRQLAEHSLKYNVEQDPQFAKLFPDYVERYEEEKLRQPPAAAAESSRSSSSMMMRNGGAGGAGGAAPMMAYGGMLPQGLAALAGIVAILSFVLAYRFT